jgi:hypothetical protein
LRKIVPSGSGIYDRTRALIESSLFGVAISKLYSGSWGKSAYEEKVVYNPNSY